MLTDTSLPPRQIDFSALPPEDIKLLNELSLRNKETFHECIRGISSDAKSSIDWLVSSTLSRDQDLCSIYLQFCQLDLLRAIVERGEPVSRVIVRSRGLQKAVKQYLMSQGSEAIVVLQQSVGEFIRVRTRPYLSLLYCSGIFSLLWLSGRRRRCRAIPRDRDLTLLDMFLSRVSFSPSGTFLDRYYPGLLEKLTDQERETVFYIPQLLDHLRIFRHAKLAERSQVRFLNKHDFLTIRDYLFALAMPFRMKSSALAACRYRDFAIHEIIEEEYRYSRWNYSSLMGLVNYRFFQRLRASGVRLRLVIDWFENQVIDKGFNKGVGDFYPGVRTKGYQGFIVSLDYNFYLQPTADEVDAGLIPDEVCVVGSGLVPQLRKFHTGLKVTVAPAFRFQHLLTRTTTPPSVSGKALLVALPIGLQESADILMTLGKAMHDHQEIADDIIVKPHPELPMAKLTAMIGGLDPRFRIISGQFSACLSDAVMLIGNSSSTCMEALAAGIPVVLIDSRSGLTQNPIPEGVARDMWRLCYSSNDVAAAIKHFRELPDAVRSSFQSTALDIRSRYFEPVTGRAVRAFLDLNGLKDGRS